MDPFNLLLIIVLLAFVAYMVFQMMSRLLPFLLLIFGVIVFTGTKSCSFPTLYRPAADHPTATPEVAPPQAEQRIVQHPQTTAAPGIEHVFSREQLDQFYRRAQAMLIQKQGHILLVLPTDNFKMHEWESGIHEAMPSINHQWDITFVEVVDSAENAQRIRHLLHSSKRGERVDQYSYLYQLEFVRL